MKDQKTIDEIRKLKQDLELERRTNHILLSAFHIMQSKVELLQEKQVVITKYINNISELL